MQCITPLTLRSPDGYKQADLHTPATITVPCGKCYACKSNLRNSWSYRLQYEAKHHIHAYFITLTYSDDNLEYIPNIDSGEIIPTVNKKTLQNFIKRLRSKYDRYTKLRHFSIGEYGGATMRPHYHLIIFSGNCPLIDKDITDAWTYGTIVLYPVSDANIHYITKYHLHRDHHPEGANPPFALMSKKPGIGANYLTDNALRHTSINTTYVFGNNGLKLQLPRYYQDKLYTDDNGLKALLQQAKLRYRAKLLSDDRYSLQYLGDEAYNDIISRNHANHIMLNHFTHIKNLQKLKL